MSKYSKTIAGCMSWGKWGKQLDTEQMTRLLQECIEASVTTFDHADIYGDYTTEQEFGKAFQKSNIDRTQIQLISKCGIQYIGKSRPTNRVKHYEYSKEYIVWSVEQSLHNLQTDYLDLLLLHRPSPLMNADEISEAIDVLITQGKIKEFGVSNFTPNQTALIQSKTKVAVNQIEISLTQTSPMLDGSLDYMQLHQIQPMAWSPLGKFFKENSEQTNRIQKELDVLSQKYGVSNNALLLAWLYQHPAGIIPVIGTTNIERIKEAVAAQKTKLETEDWFALLVASQGHKVP